MKTVQLFSAANAASNQTSPSYQKADQTEYFVQVVFSSATLAGTFYLSASADNITFSPILDSMTATSAGTTIDLNFVNANYRYIQGNWVASAGTGTITATMNLVEKLLRV